MKSVKFLSVAGAIAAVAFAAPGAGFAAEAAAAAGTSGACFNKGLYAEGAVVDFDTKINGSGVKTSFRTVTTAKANETYRGVSAIPVESESFDAKGKSQGVVTGYYQIEPAFLLLFGTVAKDSETFFTPAGSQPIDQKQGSTYKQKYDMTSTGAVGELTTSRQATWKFAGVEKVKLPLGKIKLCKITAKFVDKLASFSTVTNQTIYVAAEGKYRGFALRTKTSTKLSTGQPINTTSDVTKIRKFAPK